MPFCARTGDRVPETLRALRSCPDIFTTPQASRINAVNPHRFIMVRTPLMNFRIITSARISLNSEVPFRPRTSVVRHQTSSTSWRQERSIGIGITIGSKQCRPYLNAARLMSVPMLDPGTNLYSGFLLLSEVWSEGCCKRSCSRFLRRYNQAFHDLDLEENRHDIGRII